MLGLAALLVVACGEDGDASHFGLATEHRAESRGDGCRQGEAWAHGYTRVVPSTSRASDRLDSQEPFVIGALDPSLTGVTGG